MEVAVGIQISHAFPGNKTSGPGPTALCTYELSITTTATTILFQGKPVYANYGQKEDFQKLKEMNIPINGSVVLVRAGKITFAEKVSDMVLGSY